MSFSKAKKPSKTTRKPKSISSRPTFDHNLEIKYIKPKTDIQDSVFKCWDAQPNKHLLLHGTAGTGKSFIAIYLALKSILERQEYPKLIIIRSTSQIREMGFLKGTATEKISEFELPYKSICTELLGRGDAYEILKAKGVIEFISTAFLRGTTFNDAIVIADEIQNYTEAEALALMTRVGHPARVILSGDELQVDLSGKKNDTSWIKSLLDIVYDMENFETFEFEFDDIVRSQFVKDFLISKKRIVG